MCCDSYCRRKNKSPLIVCILYLYLSEIALSLDDGPGHHAGQEANEERCDGQDQGPADPRS